MAIRELQGLRGLKGLSSLSREEQAAFMKSHADILDKYDDLDQRDQIANILYMNNRYIKTFGRDNFNLNNDGTEEAFNSRNEKMRTKLITDAFIQNFGNDSDFKTIAPWLDTDGMYDLLTNQEYLGDRERQKKYATNLAAAKKVGKTYDKVLDNPYIDAMGKDYMFVGKAASALTPQQILDKDKEKDQEILDRLKAETRKRREEIVQGDTDLIYSNMLEADNSGKQSLAQTLKEFDNLAMKNSNYYKGFKNSKWLRDYSDEDKLKDYAKFLALKSKYGEGIALQYLEQSMQDRVAEAQDGKFTGNTLKGILTTTWSDLGSNVALFANMGSWMNADRMAILNQGKDPDKPIYDKKGNIVDYQENDNIWTNPAYWNNVYKYNTFSPTEIKAIEERGGVSDDVNVRSYGSTPDFLSWDTLEEGFKQSGHVFAGVIETAATGSAGKVIGLGGKAILKGLGLSAKAMQTAAKVGSLTNNIFVTATTGLEGSQLEAMGTFEDQLQSAKEKINAQIERELYDYQKSIDYNSKSAKSAINSYYNQLKAKDRRRVALGNTREGAKAFPLSDATLMAQAKQLYTNQLLGAKQQELQELHKKDEMEAAKDAAKAYGTNFIMDYIKNIPLTTGIQRYKIAKGAMRSTFDNTIKDNIVADLKTGGVRRVFNKVKDKATKQLVDDEGNIKRFASAKALGKEMVKQLGAGFADEYLDGINASFASGVGNNEFNNYINKNYNPKSYDSTVDTMLGNLLSGLSEGINGITDRENLYEGFIGMLSPAATSMVNPNMVFHPKDAWNALRNGTDANGNKISRTERLSSVFMNPLLNSIAEAKEKDRALDNTVDAINKVVAANKDKINDASKIISVLNNYDGPIEMNQNSILDYKDNKLYNAFTLINALNSLENVEGGESSQLYQDTMHTLEGLANGTLTQEELDNEIDMALADKDNKSIVDDKNAREEVAKRLQKNAQYFMDMKDKVAEVSESFANSPSLMKEDPALLETLMYNIVASDDYKKRLESLKDDLGISHTDTESMYTPNYSLRYGSAQSQKRAMDARDREIDKIDKEINKLQDSISYVEKKIKVLDRQQNNDTKKTEIQKQKALLDSYKFQMNTLKESKKQLSKEKEEIGSIEMKDNLPVSSFSEADILGADVRDMAYILDEENSSNFTEGRKKIIDSVRNSLLQKDPEALTKLRDASALATRIEDAKTAYSKLMNNKELASTYLDSVGYVRERDAIAESLQRDIKNHYGRIESAYISRNEEPEIFRNEILSTNSELISAYMEDHPEQTDAIKPYYDILKFDEDAVAVIRDSDYSKEEKEAMLTTILGLQNQSESREDLESKIEGIIDSEDVNTDTKEKFNNLMSKMEQLGYQRDATTIENRKQRLQREEEERKRKEEEQKKANEEAKASAEEKAAKDNDEEKHNLNSTNAVYQEGSAEDVPLDSDDVWDDETSKQKSASNDDYANFEELTSPYKDFDSDDYDWQSNQDSFKRGDLIRLSKDFSDSPDEEGQYEKGRYYYYVVDDVHDDGSMTGRRVSGDKNGTNIFNDDVTTTKVILNKDDRPHFEKAINKKNKPQRASNLMQTEAKDGKVNAGEIMHGKAENPKKGQLVVEKKGNKITFSVDGKKVPLTILPSEYEVVTDEQETKKNEPFIANSLEKKDGDWYFIDNFAGETKSSEVKAKENFNLDKALERQQAANEADLVAQGANVGNKNILDTGDSVQGRSETLDEQSEDATQESKEEHTSDVNDDASVANGIGLDNIDNSATTLGGNAMSRYEPGALQDEGRLVKKKGSKENDNMNRYYAWMEAAGIKLQNIIDHELARIIKRNPHAKVKFMAVKIENNATHDDAMQSHLMLVLDYDNSINKNITSIHDDANGGVIESNGKKYLIIGTASYGNRNASKQALYDMLWNPYISGGFNLKKQRKQFFDSHPNERFYVNEELSTEVVPASQIPGYIVRQTEKDEHPEFRSVKELLADEDRNPMHYEFKELAWGIQEISKFLVVGAPLDNVMVPRHSLKNSGSAFVLMPASNGKMVPSYLKVLKYAEMRDGTLKDRVNKLLQDVASPNYMTRLQAVIGLSKIFYFDKDGDTILLRKNRNELSLVHDGKVQKTFVLDSNFDRQQFMQAFEDINPRVNITADVLRNQDTLEEYDEAGALMTDAAMFGTVGSSYSIYGLDGDGKMIKPETAANNTTKASSNSDFRNGDRSQVIYKHNYYTYNESEGNFYLDGKLITDEKELTQLRYNKQILDNDLTPVTKEGVWDFYVLSNGDHPEGIKVNKNTKEVKEVPEERVKEIIQKITEEKASEAREEAAKKATSENTKEVNGTIEDVPLTDDDGSDLVIDSNTGEMISRSNQEDTATHSHEEKETPAENTSTSTAVNPINKSMENLKGMEHKEGTQSFKDLINNKEYKMRVLRLVRKKWKDAPRKPADIEKFLRSKNVEVDAIGTSKADIEAWIRTIEDCR